MICKLCFSWMIQHNSLLEWKKCLSCGFSKKGNKMDLKINRTQYRSDGIFGEMSDSNGKVIAYTLEHAYLQDNGSYAPKVPVGIYTCKRGEHRLHGMVNDFTTFEITNVPNHTNILFHWGNWNNDSDGCCLLGAAIVPSSKGQMITNSKVIFQEFMTKQINIVQFQITIS